MKKTWVVAAESSRARIYAVQNRIAPLRLVEELDHPEARLHEREINSDRPGRAFDSAGQGRHAMEPQVAPKQQEAVHFARRIAENLEQGRVKGEFEQLVLVAAPEFLGILRQCMGDHLLKVVDKTINKNLTQQGESAIREQMFV